MRAIPFLLSSLLSASALLAQSEVKVWQDTATFRTYREDNPNLVPQFDIFGVRGGGIQAAYPYAYRTRMTSNGYDAPWRVLHLENEYLHCRILPDLGGKLYGCLDKLSGGELFYAISTLKKTDTGTRGAWVAGGIELNFPVAHTRMAVSPVDFALASEPSGAGTVYVGAVDRVTGMEWRVAFTLRPGSTVLEQKVRLYNPGNARQPYQWWANAAIRVPDRGLRTTYPTYVTAPHGAGVLDRWPVNMAGVDMSQTANIRTDAGLFAYGSREPFFAAYNPESKVGVSHWADPEAVPGKKMWVWGTASGYRKIYSDDNSGYMEIQAGVMETQDMFAFLEPQQTRSFTELWIPSRDSGGVTRAAPDAVLYMERRRQPSGTVRLAVDVNATHAIPGATLLISQEGRTAYRQTADLSPAKVFHAETPESGAAGKFRFELKDRTGKVLLAHEEDTYDAAGVSEVKLLAPPPAPQAALGTEASFLRAVGTSEERRQHTQALEFYARGLSVFPKSLGLRKGSARLAMTMGRYEEAAGALATLRREYPGDAEIAYYLGAAQAGMGKDEEAASEFRAIPAGSAFAPAARFELACIEARAGRLQEAAAAMRGLAARLPRAAAMEIALLRRLGRTDEAKKLAQERLAAYPADSFLRFEGTMLGRDDAGLWRHLGSDPERVLNVVDDYFELGLWEEPVSLLAREYPAVPELEKDLAVTAPQEYPLCLYYLGYARQRLGKSPAADFEKASALSTAYVFPSRASSFAVLRAALETNPKDATAHYLMGSLQMTRRRTDAALEEWAAAKPAAARIPAYYETVARVLDTVKGDREKAAAVAWEGLAANPADQPLRALAKTLGSPPAGNTGAGPAPGGSLGAAARAGGSAAGRTPAPSSPAEAALFMLASGNAAGAAAIFSKGNFPNRFYPFEVRRAYIETRMQEILETARKRECGRMAELVKSFGAEDKALPLTLGGFLAFINQPRMQFYLGLAEAVCGNRQAAAQRWSAAAKIAAKPLTADFAFPAVAAALLDEAAGARTLEQAIERVRTTDAGDADKGLLLYAEGVLLRAAGRQEEARQRFEEGAKSGPAYTRYVNAAALLDPPPPK